jgi:hypothetical protein
VGAAAAAASPLNMLFATVSPVSSVEESMKDPIAMRTSLVVGTVIACVLYGLACFLMHASMKRGFMMVVRRLAGTN